MRKKVNKIINGQYCYKCEYDKLYQLSDQRFKCKNCSFKYSSKRIKLDYDALHYFSLEIPANKVAKDFNCDYGNIHRKYIQYRKEIFEFLNKEFQKLSGEIECDESYFGGRRKGQRGRGSRGKVKVFGMLERHGQIYTTIVDNVKAETLMNEIKHNSLKGSVFYTDKFRSYKSLKFYGKHLQIDHGKIFAKGRRHINGLEGFWSFAKERLLKYHGVSHKNFLLYLKEMEFRYNYRDQNIFDLLLQIHFGPVLH